MIARNERNQVRQRRANHSAAIQAKQKAQATINAVLYTIIKQSAEAAEDQPEVEEGEQLDAVLTVPITELDKVPVGFGISVKWDTEAGTIALKATNKKPKSNILLPDGKPMGGN